MTLQPDQVPCEDGHDRLDRIVSSYIVIDAGGDEVVVCEDCDCEIETDSEPDFEQMAEDRAAFRHGIGPR